MKLDRLLALIKLANNNPNENEANAAARLVCKELIDAKGNFKDFTITAKQTFQPSKKQEEFHGGRRAAKSNKAYQDINDMMNDIFGFGRYSTAGATSKPKTPPRGVNREAWEHFNNQAGKSAPEPDNSWDRETTRTKANPYPGSGPEYVRYSGFDWVGRDNSIPKEPKESTKQGKTEYYYDANGNRKYKEEMRKCSKCGLEIMTRRIHEDPWICNPCHWKEAL